MTTIKENANPIIHDVSHDASTMSSWETVLETELVTSGCDTPANRAIRQALHESCYLPERTERTLLLQWPSPFPWTTTIASNSRNSQANHHDNNIVMTRTHEEAAVSAAEEKDDSCMTADEVFEYIRTIQDPEHPLLTLEQLGVVSLHQIDVNLPYIRVRFTPTIPHCSMATLIGLTITVKLIRSMSTKCKINVSIEPGTHNSELSINKQLADKERVCAALENKHLLDIVNKCLCGTDTKQ